MAGTDRAATVDLTARLLRDAPSFTFFQAIRLLQGILRQERGEGGPPADVWDRIHIRPNLSLAFPETDLDAIEALPDHNGYRVTANFYGLYGVSSPLPTFYTEDLIEEQRADKRAVRAFLDIFHYAIYPIFFEAWAKNRQFLTIYEEGNAAHLDQLYALIGFGEPAIRDRQPHAYQLLRYAGLFTQSPRSAMGLETLLSDALAQVPVAVESCVPKKMDIPADQRLILGEARDLSGQGRLGQGAWLGQSLDDRMNHFLIRVGPVSAEQYHQLLPGQPQYGWLKYLVRLYLVGCLGSTLQLVLKAGSLQPACLGVVQWGRLGLDTWIFSGTYEQEGRVPFALYH
ncbi:MAG: type VI secretion system baseplate subunit TssG [Nitrospirota bacterium]|nr:type VI secretion system baseplate subunit TssG [Nitrospirota bacterium]